VPDFVFEVLANDGDLPRLAAKLLDERDEDHPEGEASQTSAATGFCARTWTSVASTGIGRALLLGRHSSSPGGAQGEGPGDGVSGRHGIG
jgi:hypothetical protein